MGSGMRANLLKRMFASKCILAFIEINEHAAFGAQPLIDGFLRIRRDAVLRGLNNLKAPQDPTFSLPVF